MPARESSTATVAATSTPRRSAASRYGSGSGFGRLTSSPLTTTSNSPTAAANGSARTANDDVTSAIGMPAACTASQQLLGARLPRDPGGDTRRDALVEEVHDLVVRQVDPARGERLRR